ncbi:MAG: hypothetical protein LPK11_10005 [Chromatiaceae bacterium]|nr:hypothetical protein [Chromatiaceae bacterium]
MQDRQYNGVVLEDKWGKTYLCSSCLLAWADLGSNTVRELADSEYGRYFLHDLEPGYNLRDIWAQLYQHARPWATDLSKLNNFQLRDTLLQMFARDEMRVWQLSDGWGKQPEGNGIGEGGLASASSGNTSSKPAAKTAKPKGGGVTTEAPVVAKAAGHEGAVAKPVASKKVEPESLEHAQQILAERRKQIEQSGYQPKYSDAELLAMAKAGDIANDRFHVRFMAASNLRYNSLGAALQGNTGKGAKYWSTTFDQMEAADTDPELICKTIGIDYDPKTDYALVIIDAEKAHKIADTKCVVASFDELNKFCKEELSSKFTHEEIDTLLSDEYQQYYAKKYEEACASPFMESPGDIDGAYDYFTEQNMPEEELALLKKRIDMHKTLGNNEHYLGNGLTKNLLEGKQQYGVVETVNFERRMVSIDDYGDAIIVNSKLTPIKG